MTPVTVSWFMVIVPVLSAQSTSIVAASSAALRRVTSTPRLASSFAPTAMLTVNMTGSATGTALNKRTSMRGIISMSGAPRMSDRTVTTPSSAPTMTKSQRTTPATTASMWSFGRAPCTSCVVQGAERKSLARARPAHAPSGPSWCALCGMVGAARRRSAIAAASSPASASHCAYTPPGPLLERIVRREDALDGLGNRRRRDQQRGEQAMVLAQPCRRLRPSGSRILSSSPMCRSKPPRNSYQAPDRRSRSSRR